MASPAERPAVRVDAWTELERLRWDGPPPCCVRCRVAGRCRLLPGPEGERRVWHCAACRSRFSVLAGTLLAGSRVAPDAWLELAADVAAGGERPVRALARDLGLTPPTVRLLRSRLAAAGICPGDEPAAALRRVLRLDAEAVVAVRRSRPGRARPREGPSADYR